ncbi:hypothetical protein OHS58_17920 [Amycolatopsis sp. NBC_00348]
MTAARCVEGREPGGLTVVAGRQRPDGTSGRYTEMANYLTRLPLTGGP